ncbi:MAG: tyrosine-type recombinase/integrase [Anaerotignaceae bacterium]
MRNPNGFGGIVDLGKNRRKRYGVRITDTYTSAQLSKDGTFKQKYKYIGYYTTRKEAIKALAEYNSSSTPINYIDITFGEVWAKWCQKNLPADKKSARYYSYTTAYNKCIDLHNIKIKDIRLDHLENVIVSNKGASKSTLNNIKNVMNFAFIWAIQNDIITKNYVEYLKISDYKEVESHTAFTSDEIQKFWENKMLYMPVLLYIYTGCRPSEITSLTKADVHLDEQYFYIGKAKTKAGIRYVPIADKIKPFFEYYMTKKGKKFFDMTYKELRQFYIDNIPNHTPHDTRSTFVSMMISAGVQESVVQKIVGHSGGNVTRDVYTQLEIKTLLEAVNKI